MAFPSATFTKHYRTSCVVVAQRGIGRSGHATRVLLAPTSIRIRLFVCLNLTWSQQLYLELYANQ